MVIEDVFRFKRLGNDMSSLAMEFSLNGVELSLNSVNSGNSENLRNH